MTMCAKAILKLECHCDNTLKWTHTLIINIWLNKKIPLRLNTNRPADTAVTSSTLGTFLRPPQRAVLRRFVRQTAAVPWHERRRSEAAAVRCSSRYGLRASEQPK